MSILLFGVVAALLRNQECILIRVCFVKCDVTSKYDWSEMWSQAEAILGGKIEILCNNAGVTPSVSLVLKVSGLSSVMLY